MVLLIGAGCGHHHHPVVRERGNPEAQKKAQVEKKTQPEIPETNQAKIQMKPEFNIQGKSERGEKKLPSATLPARPDWIGRQTAVTDGCLIFFGASSDCPTRELSRAQALKDAQFKAVDYIISLARLKFERLSVSNNPASRFIDPDSIAHNYREFLSADMAMRAKESEVYEEEQSTPAGIVHRSYILVRMPLTVVKKTLKDFTNYCAVKARKAAKDAPDKVTQKQARKEAEFWKTLDPDIFAQ